MGHDIHFLERMTTRANPEHQALALALYRDPELIRHIVDNFWPMTRGEVDRLALALADGGQGPHVIVTKQGKFVTCLGEGMDVGQTQVVSRALLDESAQWRGHMRARYAPAEERINKFLLSLRAQGRTPTRAEILEVEALGALNAGVLGYEVLEGCRAVVELTDRLLKAPRRMRRDAPNPALRDALLMWSRRLRFTIHCVVMLTAIMPRISPLWREQLAPHLHTFVVAGQTFMVTPAGIMLASWCLNHAPSCSLEWLSQGCELHAIHRGPFGGARVAYALAVWLYALERPAQREQVIDWLRDLLVRTSDQDTTEHFASVTRVNMMRTLWALEQELDHAPLETRFARLAEHEFSNDQPWHAPLRALAHAPAEALRALLALDTMRMSTIGSSWILWALAPELAGRTVGELYEERPAKIADAAQFAQARELYAMLVFETQHYRELEIQERKPAQGRNEPCACGSGKKYKRCCGQDADEEA